MATMQIWLELPQCQDHCQQLLPGHAVVLLSSAQVAAKVGYCCPNTLGQYSTNPYVAVHNEGLLSIWVSL